MFPSINPVKRLQRELADEIDAGPSDPPASVVSPTGLTDLLRSFGPAIDDTAPSAPAGAARGDWSGLIERIRSTARHIRDVEAEALARDEQMEHLLHRVREDMAEAEARVRAAEAQAALTEARAAEQIRASEARAQRAEERARISEEWLERIQDVIQSEFAGSLETLG